MSFGNEREFIDYLQRKEGKTMKCPLFLVGRTSVIKSGEGGIGDCLKEECAWWNEHNNECCFISTGKVLNAISTYLYEIKEKMPHELQFRK